MYYMMNHMDLFRHYYWLYKLDTLFYVYLLTLILLKLIGAFAGHALRSLHLGLFICDLALSYFVIIGIYFYLNNYLKDQYIYSGHYVYLFVDTMSINSVFYLISTLFTIGRGFYNWILGFFLMEIGTLLTLTYYY